MIDISEQAHLAEEELKTPLVRSSAAFKNYIHMLEGTIDEYLELVEKHLGVKVSVKSSIRSTNIQLITKYFAEEHRNTISVKSLIKKEDGINQVLFFFREMEHDIYVIVKDLKKSNPCCRLWEMKSS